MTEYIHTDQIDQVRSIPFSGGWEISFRSGHAGLHHQLYIAGRLADITDHPDARRFILPTDQVPRRIEIVAVETQRRFDDHSKLLPSPPLQWMGKLRVVARMSPPGSLLAVLTDHAGGVLDETPVLTRQAWPGWLSRWAWGDDRFGLGGFGYNGSLGPGAGKGSFGAGPLGIGAETFELDVPLDQTGVHQVVLRTISPDGQTSDAPPRNIECFLPPSPAEALEVIAYDHEESLITLQISP